MKKRTIKVALLAALAALLILGLSSVVHADQTWSDLPDTVTAKYGITDNQVAEISEGFAGGLWRPFSGVTRAQFTKMAVAAFNIPLANSAIASYVDVPKGSFYYKYVEGAKAAGVVAGTTATTFSPNVKITRQQAIAIVARYIAKAQGFDLATMYTADEITHLLAHFGDAASISTDLRDEVAFAFDMGLTKGDDFGNVNPQANLTRIQGAAFLIRAEALVPPEKWVPAKIELMSVDKSEGLIGQAYTVTYRVTTASGHPAIGVLVDFDALIGPDFYVGQVEPEAQVTDTNGEVTVQLISAEPGVERLSATVGGLPIQYTTRYWLALDEVYNTKGKAAQNNAGVNHTWGVRVVVFGPGPRSTSVSDWYNAIKAAYVPGDAGYAAGLTYAFDSTNVNVIDGIDANNFGFVGDAPDITDSWSILTETALALSGYKPRTLAGVSVKWSIYDVKDDPLTGLVNEAVTSVGNIVAVDGAAVTPTKTATGKTDVDGLSTITVYSEASGKTLTQAIADYTGNPYPQQLFDHGTFEQAVWWHNFDWDDQPPLVDIDHDGVFEPADGDYYEATQVKTWISHTLGGGTGPISPAYQGPNVGEEKTLTITLKDVYGNPVSGKGVEWYMQGVGFFQTDDSQDTSDPHHAVNNKDLDVTDAKGQANVFVKSYDSGEQIVHAKVRDKGTGGAEGAFTTYTAEVQWFDVDIVTFDDITTQWLFDYHPYTDVDPVDIYQNEALSSNAVNGSHVFTVHVFGLKLEYDPTVDEPDGQTPYIDSDAAGHSYDGIIDATDAAYYGGILMWPLDFNQVQDVSDKLKQLYETKPGLMPFDEDQDGVIERHNHNAHDERGTEQVKINGMWLTLSFEGAYTMYDFDDDGFPEGFTGNPGIYLPLAGKTVTFTKANEDGPLFSNLGAFFDGDKVTGVGSFTPSTPVVTDSAGKATVTVTSTVKGPETIKAVVDWPNNPHNGPELLSAYAKKNWVAGTTGAQTDVTIEIYIDGVKVATNKLGELAVGHSAAWTVATADDTLPNGTDYVAGDLLLNSAHVEVHVKDAYGNDLPDYEVVYLLEDINGWMGGSQNAYNTYLPFAYLFDKDPLNIVPFPVTSSSVQYDLNGDAPDSDEPTPGSDPYGFIVGLGGTDAFFFNQWLGSEKPTSTGQPGIPLWWTRIPGFGLTDYVAAPGSVAYSLVWPRPQFGDPIDPNIVYSPFDGVLEGAGDPASALAPAEIGLATDGAKAWTLDGFFRPAGLVIPNLLTGSQIDIQLADDIIGATLLGIHVESILRVMVYAPADGLVKEGNYIWSTQVQQVWEEPVPTVITLSPASDYAIAGLEGTALVATVKDQFGNPMPNVDVGFVSTVLEGDLTNTAETNGLPGNPVTTDENGNAAIAWSEASGDWGVERVVASAGTVSSQPALIQWIYDDSALVAITTPGFTPSITTDLVQAVDAQQKVTAFAGFTPWNGRTLSVYTAPGGAAVGSGLYATLVDANISTSSHAWTVGEAFFVGAVSTNTDGVPNWVYDITVGP